MEPSLQTKNEKNSSASVVVSCICERRLGSVSVKVVVSVECHWLKPEEKECSWMSAEGRER